MCSRGILKIPNNVFSQEITLEMELNCIDFLCGCSTIVVVFLSNTNWPMISPPQFDHKARVLSVFWNHTCTAALSGGPHLVRKQRAGSNLIMLYLSNPCFMVPTSRDLSASPSHQLVGGRPSHIGGTSGSSLKMKYFLKQFVKREVNYIYSTWLCLKCD